MPFFKTALIDLNGAKIPEGSSGEALTHYGAITLRITGTGNFDMQLLSQDEIQSRTITPLAMQTTDRKQPTKLTNFIQQRAQLKGSTDVIDEIFTLQRLVIWVKPIYSQFPS